MDSQKQLTPYHADVFSTSNEKIHEYPCATECDRLSRPKVRKKRKRRNLATNLAGCAIMGMGNISKRLVNGGANKKMKQMENESE